MIEQLARITVEVDYGSGTVYRDSAVPRICQVGDLQSGDDRGGDDGGRRREARQKGTEDAGDLQRGRLDDYARSRARL